MSAKWDVGSFNYINGKFVGIGNGNAFIFTPNGKFDADNQMLPVKVKLFNDLDFRPMAPFMLLACSELNSKSVHSDCAPRTESELKQLEKQFVETANKYKLGQDVDGSFLLYNASKEPNKVRLGLKSADGKIMFEGSFISKLNDADMTSLANFSTTGNIPERSKLIDEFANSSIAEKRAQFAKYSALPFFKLAGDVAMLEQAYAKYFKLLGNEKLDDVDDWSSLGLKSAPVATNEVSSISISVTGKITATVAPGYINHIRETSSEYIGETPCETISFEPKINYQKTVDWYAETTCPKGAIAILDDLAVQVFSR